MSPGSRGPIAPLLLAVLGLAGCTAPASDPAAEPVAPRAVSQVPPAQAAQAQRELRARGFELDGETMVQAVRRSDLQTLQWLLEAGVAPDVVDARSDTPLIVAIRLRLQPVLEALLAGGADPDFGRNADGKTALIMAAELELPWAVDRLLEAGADPDLADRLGSTALMWAASRQMPRAVSALLAAGADPNLRGGTGSTALAWAANRNRVRNIELLLAGGADAELADNGGKTPARIAVEQRNLGALAALAGAAVRSVDRDGWDLLMVASRGGDTDIVAALVDGEIPLDRQSALGWSALTIAISRWRQEAVEALLAAGADPDIRSQSAGTPLVLAIQQNWDWCAERLLASGADVELRVDGRTPLQWAAVGGNPVITEALLRAGADVAATTSSGVTAAELATRHGHAELAALIDQAGRP